jgi:hypothetical protein
MPLAHTPQHMHSQVAGWVSSLFRSERKYDAMFFITRAWLRNGDGDGGYYGGLIGGIFMASAKLKGG